MNRRIDLQNIGVAVNALHRGEVVALPTETVYGLAASILDLNSIKKVFEIKARPFSDPLIVHVACPDFIQFSQENYNECFFFSEKSWDLYVSDLIKKKYLSEDLSQVCLQTITKLMDHFWPGALSICVASGAAIDKLITAGSDYVVIRSPKHTLFQKVLKELGSPLAAPSANRFQGISPTSYEDVLKEFPKENFLVVDGGKCLHGIESTIVKVDKITGKVLILRPGALSRKHLKELGFEILEPDSKLDKSMDEVSIKAPGLFRKHYAPKKPCLCLLDKESLDFLQEDIRYQNTLLYSEAIAKNKVFFMLRENKVASEISVSSNRQKMDLKLELEVTSSFYKKLRECDELLDCDLIVIDLRGCKDMDAWEALLDRSIRASSGRYFLED